jgi:cold shock CspA family protein/ribosome-associated translation inhibitor RaiA
VKLPLQITLRYVSTADRLEADVRKRAAALERYYQAIMSCRVLVERTHRHHRDGSRFHVRIDLGVPGGEIAVSHDSSIHGRARRVRQARERKGDELDAVHKHVQVAVRDAFATARRRLQDYARRQRGDVKLHEVPLHGRVARLLPDGQGFIAGSDGREVYFHRRSLIGSRFEDVEVGTDVAFVEEPGDRGPQASTVRVLGKHHYVDAMP